MTRWLITGGCGFIGLNLVRRLTEEGTHAIRILDNLSVGTRDDLARVGWYQVLAAEDLNWATDVPTLVVGDILDDSLASAVTDGADIIVHLAGNTGVGPSVADPRSDCLNNVLGTLNYLEAARLNSVSRFVFASSGAPVGEVEPPVTEDKACRPVSPYGASKLACEGYCSAYFKSYGIDTVALRFSNVYGPGSSHKASVVANFVKQALSESRISIYGDGSQTRDFLYIDDLIDAVVSAARTAGVGVHIFQIATCRETSIQQLSTILQELFSQSGLPQFRVEYLPRRTGDVQRNFADISKARDSLNWLPKMELETGLHHTLQDFIASGF